MTSRNCLACIFAGLLLLAGCGLPLSEFTSADGKFKVRMPGTPKEATQGSGKHVGFEADGQAFAVSWSDLQIAADAPQDTVAERLNTECKAAAAYMSVTLLSSSAITLPPSHAGREFLAVRDNRHTYVRARLYLVGPRLYQVLVAGPEGFVHSRSATAFLDSFSILP